MSSADKLMGNLNEIKLINYLNGLPENNVSATYQDNQYKFFKNEFNTMDLWNVFHTCELKSRRCSYTTYPDTMIGVNKISRALSNPERSFKFYFLFYDGLWCWDFNINEYSIRRGGRNDRGKDEYKDYAYIPITKLKFITDEINSHN